MPDHNLSAATAAFVRRGRPVASVIDVGASDARWSRQVSRFLPEARFHMIEAMDFHKPGLDKLCAENPRVSYTLAAAGAAVGQTFFMKTEDPLGGGAFSENVGGSLLTVPMTSIDHEVATRDLRPPFFIKLDTHGFELEILSGAARSLKDASLVQLEVYNFDLRPGAPRFPDMCRHMETLGFRCSDAFDILIRPKDGALWQFDIFFEPVDAPVFQLTHYA